MGNTRSESGSLMPIFSLPHGFDTRPGQIGMQMDGLIWIDPFRQLTGHGKRNGDSRCTKAGTSPVFGTERLVFAGLKSGVSPREG